MTLKRISIWLAYEGQTLESTTQRKGSIDSYKKNNQLSNTIKMCNQAGSMYGNNSQVIQTHLVP